MKALQTHFKVKRDYDLKRLQEIGFTRGGQDIPDNIFYIWLGQTPLQPTWSKSATLDISNGLSFFDTLPKEKAIVVPGVFFDLNPAKRRDLFDSVCHHFVRLSYGPKTEALKIGLDGIERVVKTAMGDVGLYESAAESISPIARRNRGGGSASQSGHRRVENRSNKGAGGDLFLMWTRTILLGSQHT